ncbi:hypothetical protein DEO72_LG6g486 [Vigna unguiculata]|uniref:Uncharacterized protein n=1 Tax=Vigna unguiculata TaxID=3917 RepID=A0A4D6M509_VIGUN|nr:hypothetical protein DEO72_LG6g486 [Vigna unguiculata]
MYWRRTSAIFAQASHSRLSKNCRNPLLVLGRASRSGDQNLVLSDRYSRLGENGLPKRGEKSPPKRDDVLKPLFHTRSSEFIGGTLVGMSERGSLSHAQLENAMTEGVHSRKGGSPYLFVCGDDRVIYYPGVDDVSVAMTGIFAQASLSRLGENSITLPWFLLELLLRRRAFVLSDDTSRSSERLSPKRELVGA